MLDATHRGAGRGDRLPRRAAPDHRLCGFGQDPGHLAAHRAILALPGVEPRNVVAFTFTEKAAAELKEQDLLDPRAGRRRPSWAGRDVRRDHAWIHPRPDAATRPGDLQVLGADRHHVAAARRPEQQEVRSDRLPDELSGTPTLRRYMHSTLYLQATSVLREDDVDWRSRPGRRVESRSATTWS